TLHDGRLYLAQGGTLFRVDPRTGAAEGSFALPANVIDLCSDGTSLYACEYGWTAGAPIHRIDPSTGVVAQLIVTEANKADRSLGAKGIAWRAGRLYVLEGMQGRIHEVDPASGAVTRALETGATWLAGLDFDGRRFVAGSRDAILRLDGETGKVVERIAVHYPVRSLAAGPAGIYVLEQPVFDFGVRHETIRLWPKTTLVHLLGDPIPLAPPSSWLALEPTGPRGRTPFNPDPAFARYLLDRDAAPPFEGETIAGKGWQRVEGEVKGDFAYAYAALDCADERVVGMRCAGGGALFVNGDGFAGDLYGLGTPALPVSLRAGTNHLFVRGMRGGFRLEIEPLGSELIVSQGDATLPDLGGGAWAGIVVANASREALASFTLGGVSFPEGLAPLAVRKVAVPVPGPLLDLGGGRSFPLAPRTPREARRHTFLSAMDGSAQEYALLPPTGAPARAGIVLSLHGAGVDCLNQARAYSPKPDLFIVCPTNRRPFGFDWQDWGRRDAYEALAHARAVTGARRDRTFLAGHSMGGHGTWHLAANDPDAFDAIAPSAGWSSFDSYGGRPAARLDAVWRGADGASLTLDLIANLAPLPIFILHGADDDNVPPSEARLMEAALRAAGAASLEVHFQEKAGHWWDGSAAAGADCVDWRGIFDLFARARRPADPDTIDFVCADPGVDSEHFWVRVHQPLRYGSMLRVKARREPGRVLVTTENVRRLKLSLRVSPTALEIDGTPLRVEGEVWLLREGDRWSCAAPPAAEKSPGRSGPFKRAFDRRFLLVVGKEDREALARARYDAQVWWYRGNGDAPVVTDERFLQGEFSGRNVILYGNAATNRAWDALLPRSCPVRAEEGRLAIGDREWKGDALGCLFVYPRKGDGAALVGVFASTGPRGQRLGSALLPFVSGVGYPDFAAFDASLLEGGDAGVLEAGWFTPDWNALQR
ncbi:MAG: prolyl oligopeptidase family serine peptidase, partial [Planctomycetaceae bacterium]